MMRERLRFSTLVLALCLLVPLRSEGQITVDKVYLTFSSKGRPFADVRVANSAPKALRIIPYLEHVTENASQENEKTEPSEDILVSPRRLSLPEQGSRTVRLLLKKGFQDTEQVYRLTFNPDPTQPIEDDETMTVVQSGSRAARVKVITTVGMLIFVEPRVASPNLQQIREGAKIIFNNPGNVHATLKEGLACNTSNKVDCERIIKRRVHPGQTVEIEVDAKKWVYFTRQYGETGVGEELAIPPANQP